MPPSDCRLERINPNHDLRDFRCGKEPLDNWLRSSALNAEKMGTARTRVWADFGSSVLAYFSLAPHYIQRDEVPPKEARGSPERIPAILLAKLALDRSRHGRGDGGLLLVDALTAALEGIRGIGGRLIVVDAIDEEASEFYQHHGFTPTPNPERLVVKASSVAASLRLPWP